MALALTIYSHPHAISFTDTVDMAKFKNAHVIATMLKQVRTLQSSS